MWIDDRRSTYEFTEHIRSATVQLTGEICVKSMLQFRYITYWCLFIEQCSHSGKPYERVTHKWISISHVTYWTILYNQEYISNMDIRHVYDEHTRWGRLHFITNISSEKWSRNLSSIFKLHSPVNWNHHNYYNLKQYYSQLRRRFPVLYIHILKAIKEKFKKIIQRWCVLFYD